MKLFVFLWNWLTRAQNRYKTGEHTMKKMKLFTTDPGYNCYDCTDADIEAYCREYNIEELDLGEFSSAHHINTPSGFEDDTEVVKAMVSRILVACTHASQQFFKAWELAKENPTGGNADRMAIAAIEYTELERAYCYACGLYSLSPQSLEIWDVARTLQQEKDKRYKTRREESEKRGEIFKRCKAEGKSNAAAFREIAMFENPKLKEGTNYYLQAIHALELWYRRNKKKLNLP